MIVTSPAFVLSTPTKTVEDFDDPVVAKTIADLYAAFRSRDDAVGVAAPQIGVGLAICLVAYPHNTPAQILINPTIVDRSDKTVLDIEGCLSVPNKAYFVSSPEWVQVHYQDERGTIHTEKAEGYRARVLRHEIDHLNGRIISDHGQKVDTAVMDALMAKSARMS